jgi:ComF family protein
MKGKRMLATVKLIGTAFLECFLPQFCRLCEARIPSGDKLCSHCLGLLRPEPVCFCPLCRFEGETEGEIKEGSEEGSSVCRHESHGFVAGRAAVRAEAAILGLVHRFKYSGERDLAPLLARLILDSSIIDDNFRNYQVMCPIPLFRTRLRERGFNQSAEIAKRLEIHSGVPLIVDLLSKVRPTAEQAKLAAGSRRRNLLGSFVVTRAGVVSGKSVVLVDDVVTTGSTVAACVEALRTSGVSKVLVVSVAA